MAAGAATAADLADAVTAGEGLREVAAAATAEVELRGEGAEADRIRPAEARRPQAVVRVPHRPGEPAGVVPTDIRLVRQGREGSLLRA